MNHRFDDRGFWRGIKMLGTLWPVVISVIILITTFAIMRTTLDAHDSAIKINTQEHKVIDTRITRLEANMDLLPEMRSDIKRLLTRKRND